MVRMEEAGKEVAQIISTGNSEIDKKMGGGIPTGSLTLIEGHSDAGKSVLTQQMLWGSLRTGLSCILFTTEHSLKRLMKQMESLGLDVTDYLLLKRLKVFPVQVAKSRSESVEAFASLLSSMRRLPSGLFVVDSITGFVMHSTLEDTLAFYEGCKEVCKRGASVVTTVHSHAFEESALIRIRSLCDAHLRLRLEEVGDRLVKVLEVAKIRGAEKNTGNVLSFEVEPGLGMRIIPVSRAKA